MILRGSELKLEVRVKDALCPARLFAETGPFRRCEVIPTRHGNVQSDDQRRSVIFFDATPANALGLVRQRGRQCDGHQREHRAARPAAAMGRRPKTRTDPHAPWRFRNAHAALSCLGGGGILNEPRISRADSEAQFGESMHETRPCCDGGDATLRAALLLRGPLGGALRRAPQRGAARERGQALVQVAARLVRVGVGVGVRVRV